MTCPLHGFYLNYGWEHFWCEPCRYVFPKEYVKGPFSNPKVVCPLPYISLCQTEGELLKIRTGIPDCWGDFLIHQLLGDYDSMHKEDVDIVHKLRKDYRLYLGQGIPNPWLASNVSHPVVPTCRGLKENLRKYLPQLSANKNKNRKGDCLCCKKNYLLECPDKNNSKDRSCTCKTCHSKNLDSEDSCKCIEILQNWISGDIHLKERRRKEGGKSQGKVCRCSSESSGCETDDEGTIASTGRTCHCPKNIRMAFGTISSANSDISCFERQSKHEYIFGKDFLYKGFTEKKGGFGIFPCTRNIYREDKRLRFKDVKASSKEIQTESQFFGETKKTQTENTESKRQTSNKCFRCTMYQCQQPTCKVNPFEKSVCLPPGIVRNHAVMCPFTCHDHLLNQKSYRVNPLEKRPKKKEIPKEGNSGDFQMHSKMEDTALKTYKIQDGFKTSEDLKPANSPKTNKAVDYYQPCLRSFENLKYLTDNRLKNYLRERETLRRFRNTTGQTLNDPAKLSSVVRDEPSPRQRFEKYQLFRRKPKISGSFHGDSPRKADVMYVDRGVMTLAEEGTRKKELITKYFKDVAESDESRTYGLVRSRESNRKRRKVTLKKRGRKAGLRKKGGSRTPIAVNKMVKVEPEERSEKSPRNDKEMTRKFKESVDASKNAPEGGFGELFKRSLRSENYSENLEKTYPERTYRSPDVMKFIVGDLLIDEKTET